MTREEKINLIIRALIFYEAFRSADEKLNEFEFDVDLVDKVVGFTLDNEFDIGNIHFTKHTDEV